MAGNPLIDQGTLNRVIGAVSWTNYSALAVTAPYLGRDGIRLSLMGEATGVIPTMSGTVLSPEPYMQVELAINLIRTQSLAAAYKAQMESATPLGSCVVSPDAITLGTYTIHNCAIKAVRELPFNGQDAGWVVIIGGYYLINSTMWG
jgi:hypothetical protein